MHDCSEAHRSGQLSPLPMVDTISESMSESLSSHKELVELEGVLKCSNDTLGGLEADEFIVAGSGPNERDDAGGTLLHYGHDEGERVEFVVRGSVDEFDDCDDDELEQTM